MESTIMKKVSLPKSNPSLSWRIAGSGTVWTNLSGHNVAIIEDHNKPGMWRFRIKDPSGHETWSPEKYVRPADAKEPAMERLAKMLR